LGGVNWHWRYCGLIWFGLFFIISAYKVFDDVFDQPAHFSIFKTRNYLVCGDVAASCSEQPFCDDSQASQIGCITTRLGDVHLVEASS
jgi:hypothetical protein